MKAMRKFALIGVPVLLTAVATTTFAQSADADRDDNTITTARADSPSSPQGKQRDPIAFAQKRLDRLKSKLAITAEQEPQWSAFSNTVLQQMEQLKTAHQGKRSHAVTAPERIDRRLAWMKERTAAFETVAEAAKTLYASLSPEQQQIADQKLLRWHAQRPS